ncbi:hypothetical protein ACEUA8_01370 [Aeromonas veronii]
MSYVLELFVNNQSIKHCIVAAQQYDLHLRLFGQYVPHVSNRIVWQGKVIAEVWCVWPIGLSDAFIDVTYGTLETVLAGAVHNNDVYGHMVISAVKGKGLSVSDLQKLTTASL